MIAFDRKFGSQISIHGIRALFVAARPAFRQVPLMVRWMLSSLLLFTACASSMAATRKPDGSWHLKCGSALDRCVKQAEDLCKGRGYVVLSGMSKRNLYGAELGVSQVEVREAELDVACADKRGLLPIVTSAAPAPPPAPTAAP